MTIGDRIKIRRTELGLTQIDLAIKLGHTSKASVSKIESNTSGAITLDRLENYAKALDVSPAFLAGWESTETANFGRIVSIVRKNPKMVDAIQKMYKLDDAKKELIYNLIDSMCI